MQNDLTGIFTPKFEQRLFAVARSEYNNSSYGHGSRDSQSAEVAVATLIEAAGHSHDFADETAVEIVSRVLSAIEEEEAAIEIEEMIERLAA